ncbi:MAG: hypothetical protein GEU75_17095 [Dehalococcoidia bacterium]|nr:hypothetical protein [Dehalococcoidia bacterium]
MKVYFGHRLFTPENPTWGDPVVTIHDVITRDVTRDVTRDADAIRHCECRPLAIVTYHSPDGIEWGYPGSGPADLALSILTDYFEETPEQVLRALKSLWAPRSKAAALHQRFKAEFLANELRDQWQIRADVIEVWLRLPSVRVCLERLAEEDAELAEVRALEEVEHGTAN